MLQKNFLFLAFRYLKSNQQSNSINSMIKICLAGIIIATCALALVVSVMQGFEKITYEKMQSIYPDLILDAQGNHIDFEKITPILQEELYHIKHFSEQQTRQALIYNSEYDNNPTVIYIRAINPISERLVTNLEQKIIHPKKENLSQIIHNHHILIGQKLAQTLNVSVGDEAKLLYTEDEPEQLKVTFEQSKVVVGGIFKTGIDDFDNNLIYCSHKYLESIFPESGITQVYIKLQQLYHEQATVNALKARLNVDVYSWQSLYPTLVSTLKLEKYVMFFILLLIVLIASMNLISLIFMYITQKKKEIALFICFGMPLHKIKLLFISICLFITLLGSTLGLFIAYIVGLFLQIYPCITLPDDIYLTTCLPIELDPIIFCAILVSSLVISLLASIIATKKIHALQLIQVLKQE